MSKAYHQSKRFSATQAQIEYLRAVHQGYQANTNGATVARCYGFLVFEGGKVEQIS